MKRGPGRRPLDNDVIAKKRPNAAYAPAPDVRFDQTGHWPSYGDRKRCKIPNCSGITLNMCLKCGVNLCYTKDKNCFYIFHNVK